MQGAGAAGAATQTVRVYGTCRQTCRGTVVITVTGSTNWGTPTGHPSRRVLGDPACWVVITVTGTWTGTFTRHLSGPAYCDLAVAWSSP